jgi:predicted transposase/invertase (TIGR01784 family)
LSQVFIVANAFRIQKGTICVGSLVDISTVSSVNNWERYPYRSSLMYTGIRSFGCRQFSNMVYRPKKFADPKNDLVFKKVFGNATNKDLLIDFVNKVVPSKHVKEVEYLPTNLEPDVRIKKQSILDVLCTDQNGSKYIIEIMPNNAKEKDLDKNRAVYYASKTFTTQIDKGGKYSDLKEVIFIAITDFVMFPEKEAYISTHGILDHVTYEHNLKSFTFVFLELPKYKKHDGVEGVDEWFDFFKFAEDRKNSKYI